jgi:hypothetical protein
MVCSLAGKYSLQPVRGARSAVSARSGRSQPAARDSPSARVPHPPGLVVVHHPRRHAMVSAHGSRSTARPGLCVCAAADPRRRFRFSSGINADLWGYKFKVVPVEVRIGRLLLPAPCRPLAQPHAWNVGGVQTTCRRCAV